MAFVPAPCTGSCLARCMARASAVASRRAIATYAIRPQEALLRELWQPDGSFQPLPSQRDATAAIARRQQWQTIPIEDCPKSLQAAMQEPCNEARIITEASYPYKVVFANHAWEELCGWNAEEIKGQHGLSFLQGPETEKLRLKRVSAAVKYGERVEVRLINYKKDGTPFLNRLRVTPLTTSLGQYTHMLGILEEVPVQGRNTAGQAQRGLARGANAAEQAQREQQQELAAQA